VQFDVSKGVQFDVPKGVLFGVSNVVQLEVFLYSQDGCCLWSQGQHEVTFWGACHYSYNNKKHVPGLLKMSFYF